MNRQRGLSLVELMVTAVLAAALVNTAGGLLQHANRAERATALRHGDLGECREALQTLCADLRAAEVAALSEDGCRLQCGNSEIVWALRHGSLQRQEGGREKTVAHCVAQLALSRHGNRIEITAWLRRRSAAPGPRASLSTQVTLRRAAQLL